LPLKGLREGNESNRRALNAWQQPPYSDEITLIEIGSFQIADLIFFNAEWMTGRNGSPPEIVYQTT
jgi:hypothetical protein